jgi:hypothetical protein
LNGSCPDNQVCVVDAGCQPAGCETNPQCESGQQQSQTCGNCGTQSRTCSDLCAWGPYGACGDAGACTPAAQQACGGCGSQTCGNDCQWGACALPDAGCCTPTCTAATCGQSDTCGGTCPACCYECVTGTSSCTLDTAPMVDGACPTGYSATAPSCTPCWQCSNYGEAYCTSSSCCGPWTTTGVVGGGCTCYSCDGTPGVSTVSENDACYASQENTLAKSHSNGGWCSWPSGANDVLCGFDGNNSGIPYSPPVVAGGCTSCSFTCGGACCLPATCVSSGDQCSVSSASQCCSDTVGTCFGGSGDNCCQ